MRSVDSLGRVPLEGRNHKATPIFERDRTRTRRRSLIDKGTSVGLASLGKRRENIDSNPVVGIRLHPN